MFYECKSLISLPDISKWNTSNVRDMNNLFDGCKSLISLPNISKWDISKCKSEKKRKMLQNCFMLLNKIFI